MPDAAYFRTQAARYRRLARQADEWTAQALIGMAEEYEAKAVELGRDEP